MTEGGRRLPLREAGRLPAAEPLFDRIAIVGLGRIGLSLGLAARQAWPRALVIGVDANDVLERAVRLHAVDVGADDLVVAAEAELVVLAGAEDANLKWLAELPEYVRGECTVTDTGTAKHAIVAAARMLPSRLTFIGGDPLVVRDPPIDADPDESRPRNSPGPARPDLFVDRLWVLTPTPASTVPLPRLSQFVSAIGAIPVEMTAEKHDQLAEYLHHVREWSGL